MILAEVLEAHRPYGLDCKCGEPINSDAGWAAHVRDVLRGLLTVRSVEELDALPLFSVIRYRYMSAAGWDLHQLWKRLEGGWFCISSPLNPPNQSFGTPQLPALVLYRPDWDTP